MTGSQFFGPQQVRTVFETRFAEAPAGDSFSEPNGRRRKQVCKLHPISGALGKKVPASGMELRRAERISVKDAAEASSKGELHDQLDCF